MSVPSIVLLDDDLSFTRKFSKELRDFGYSVIPRTQIESISELFELKFPIQGIIINIELKNSGGRSLFTTLRKQQKFSKATFFLLVEDLQVYNLTNKMNLRKTIILNKNEPMENIIEKVVNTISLSNIVEVSCKYVVSARGRLNKIGLNKLLEFCKKNTFSGKITIHSNSTKGMLLIGGGEIRRIIYNKLDRDEALKQLALLNDAKFTMEQRIFSYQDILDFVNLNGVNEFICINDILIDLFYFGHRFFESKLGPETTQLIFKTKFNEYAENFKWFSQVTYDPDLQEKISIKGEISEEQVDLLILLLKEIFSELSSHNGKITVKSFLNKLHELKPYLMQFELWPKLAYSECNFPEDKAHRLFRADKKEEKKVSSI